MKKLIILSIVVVGFGCSDVMGQSGSRKVPAADSGFLSVSVIDTMPYVMWYNGNNFEIHGYRDTASAILGMIKSMQKKDSMCDAAFKIAMMVTTTGFIENKNRVKYNKAVDEFCKQWSYKRPPAKMPLLIVLEQDKNGNVLHRINQK